MHLSTQSAVFPRAARVALLAVLAAAPACASGGGGADPVVASTPRTTTVSTSSASGTSTMAVQSHSDNDVIWSSTPLPVDSVWKALPGIYDQLEIAVGTNDRASGQFGNRVVRASRRLGSTRLSTLLNCGSTAFGAPMADSYEIQMSVITFVAPDPSGMGSRVRTEVRASATQPGTGSSGGVDCATTGVLEQNIARLLGVRRSR